MNHCPDIERLEQLAAGGLVGEEAGRIRSHVESCPNCGRLYDECLANRAFAPQLRAALEESSALQPAALSHRSFEERALPEGRSPWLVEGYEILRELHRGGQGVVYEAIQQATRRRVALKVMLGGPFAGKASKRRFEREVELAAGLRHPNIVTIHDSGVSSGNYYFCMDYVDGERLDAYIGSRVQSWRDPRDHAAIAPAPPTEALSIRDVLRLFGKVCEAVNYAHQRGVIHRDLKPSNILVDHDGGPRVLDFGLAKQMEESETQTARSVVSMPGQVVGTLPYMSPEQARGAMGDVDIRSDVYSLGVILYELLTGQFPYDVTGSMGGVLQNIADAEPQRPSATNPLIDDEVETIVLKALAKDRERRYQTAGDFSRDVERYLAGETIEAKRDSAMYVLKKALWRYRLPVGIAAAFVGILAVAMLVSIRAWREASQQRESLRRTVYIDHIGLAQAAYDADRIVRMKQLLFTCPADLRNWEWYHLVWLSDRSRMTLRGHTEAVTAVAFSPDGSLLASASVGGTVMVWNARTGARVRTFRQHASEVQGVAFSPDGRRVASGSDDGSAKVWDLDTGSELAFIGHDSPLRAVAFMADGLRISSLSIDGMLKVWDAGSGSEILALSGQDQLCTAAALSSDGEWAGVGTPDRSLRVWNASGGMPPITLVGHKAPIHRLAFSPDGRQVVSGDDEGVLKVWDKASGKESWSRSAHLGWVRAVAFSPDGRRIASTGHEGMLKVWDAETGDEIGELHGHDYPPIAVVFSPDGRSIATGSDDWTVKLWDANAAANTPTILHGEGVNSVAVSPDGTWLVSAGNDHVKVWDTATLQQRMWLNEQGREVQRMALSRDGRWIATCGHDGKLRLWDAVKGTAVWTVQAHERITNGPAEVVGVRAVAFSPDDRYIVSAGTRGAKLWNVPTGEEVRSFVGDEWFTVAFSPDGDLIASAGMDVMVRLWDPTTGENIRVLRGHERGVCCVVFSQDGKWLASGSTDNTLRIWDVATGELLRTFRGHQEYDVVAAAFSPDGTRIASGSYDKAITLWDVNTGAETLHLRGHLHGVTAVVFSRDGRWIASGSEEGTVKIWNTTTAAEVASNPEAAFHLMKAGIWLRSQGQPADAEAAFQEAEGIYQRAIELDAARAESLILQLVELYEKWDKPEQVARWRAKLVHFETPDAPSARAR